MYILKEIITNVAKVRIFGKYRFFPIPQFHFNNIYNTCASFDAL